MSAEGSNCGAFGLLFCLGVKFLNISRKNTGNFTARKVSPYLSGRFAIARRRDIVSWEIWNLCLLNFDTRCPQSGVFSGQLFLQPPLVGRIIHCLSYEEQCVVCVYVSNTTMFIGSILFTILGTTTCFGHWCWPSSGCTWTYYIPHTPLWQKRYIAPTQPLPTQENNPHLLSVRVEPEDGQHQWPKHVVMPNVVNT